LSAWPQSHLAIGSGAVRRLAPGFCPIAGFEQAGVPDFAALETICAPGEQLYCVGWRVDAESTTHCLLWEAPIPANDPAPDAEKLGPEHAAAAVELAKQGGVGPFGLRSIELGDYFGYFHDGRLVAMAGERFAADGLREISGVCTHPDFFHCGMARRLVLKLARRQLMRGEKPFLHVFHDNVAAHRLYQRLGFRLHSSAAARLVSRAI
jgi:ribosomal protein S18 acetylase RimI-like enzyme